MSTPCPITGQPMQRVEVHGVTADLSPSHGLWLDHGELFLITEDARHDEGGFWADLFRKELQPPADHARALLCPVCGAPMTLEQVSGVTIDWCKQHGVWLDSGELEAILNNLRLDPAYLRGVALRLSDMRY
jgi:Zn-finger nucleic acid-binding protein